MKLMKYAFSRFSQDELEPVVDLREWLQEKKAEDEAKAAAAEVVAQRKQRQKWRQ